MALTVVSSSMSIMRTSPVGSQVKSCFMAVISSGRPWKPYDDSKYIQPMLSFDWTERFKDAQVISTGLAWLTCCA